jgi:hypothetical protein
MMTKRRLIGTSDGVLLWLASVVTLGAGYYLTFGVLGNAIDRQHQRTAAISATMLANTQVLAQRPALELQAAAIAARLRRLNYGADTATSVARFIRAAVRQRPGRRWSCMLRGPRARHIPSNRSRSM